VDFDASASSDADGDPLTYDWDLDGDGAYELVDGAPRQSTRYATDGIRTVHLRVRDPLDAEGTTSNTVTVGMTSAPVAVIDTPTTSSHWSAGQTVTFSGHATDADEGTLPAADLSWSLVLLHCPATCHEHPLTTIDGVASGSFVAPDHSYPSKLELTLTATDSTGRSAVVTRILDPSTVALSFASGPSGAKVTIDSDPARATPFTRTVIRGSNHTISVVTPQTIGGRSRSFVAWSDGGARSHAITATASRSLTAWFSGGDTVAPVMTLLRVGGLAGASVSGLIPTRVRWAASDHGGTGISRYDVQISSDGGVHWTRVALSPVSRSSINVYLKRRVDYRFRVRARDKAGNVGAWVTTRVIHVSSAQESSGSMKYAGSWAAVPDADAMGGAVRRSSARASMTYTFSGRAIAWVAPRGATRGQVRVYIDGVLKATIDLGASPGDRLEVFTRDFGRVGTHTLKIVNLATSGRPTVDHDAVIIWR
jgi:PKD repeat protein